MFSPNTCIKPYQHVTISGPLRSSLQSSWHYQVSCLSCFKLEGVHPTKFCLRKILARCSKMTFTLVRMFEWFLLLVNMHSFVICEFWDYGMRWKWNHRCFLCACVYIWHLTMCPLWYIDLRDLEILDWTSVSSKIVVACDGQLMMYMAWWSSWSLYHSDLPVTFKHFSLPLVWRVYLFLQCVQQPRLLLLQRSDSLPVIFLLIIWGFEGFLGFVFYERLGFFAVIYFNRLKRIQPMSCVSILIIAVHWNSMNWLINEAFIWVAESVCAAPAGHVFQRWANLMVMETNPRHAPSIRCWGNQHSRTQSQSSCQCRSGHDTN